MSKYIDAEKLITKIEKSKNELKSLMSKLYYAANYKEWKAKLSGYNKILSFITSLQQEQLELPTIKGWIARDDADRLGLYDQKPTRKTELGAFSGIVHPWAIGDTWIGRFSLDQAAKPLFPNLCWTDDPMEVEIMFKPIQEQPEVELEKEITPSLVENMLCEFGVQSIEDVDSECLADIARHFYELGLNARKEE